MKTAVLERDPPTIEGGPRFIQPICLDPAISITATSASRSMRALGVSDQAMVNATIYMDPKNRFINLGTHYPNRIGRLRFRSNPEIQKAKGDIIRISTKVRFRQRTEQQMNHTLMHEFEHLAQQDRHDKKLTEGHLAIAVLTALCAAAGEYLGNGPLLTSVGVLTGATIGYFLGHAVAPHERQAGQRANKSVGHAIRRNI